MPLDRQIFKILGPKTQSRVVANIEDANYIRRFFNTVQGVGCRIDAPRQNGKGWRIIVDGSSDIGTPVPLSGQVETPTAFKQSGPPSVADGVASVEMYNGVIFWGDDEYQVGFEDAGDYDGTTTVTLSAGTNHVFVKLTWSYAEPEGTFETQASWPMPPTESSYKVHLATYEVDLAAETATQTFIAWNGGNIYIPSAYAST